MRVGVFETTHFEGAYPVIKCFDNGANEITIFCYEESYRQFAQLLDRYAALAAAVDDARTDDQRWASLCARLPADAHDVSDRVAAIRALLAGAA